MLVMVALLLLLSPVLAWLAPWSWLLSPPVSLLSTSLLLLVVVALLPWLVLPLMVLAVASLLLLWAMLLLAMAALWLLPLALSSPPARTWLLVLLAWLLSSTVAAVLQLASVLSVASPLPLVRMTMSPRMV